MLPPFRPVARLARATVVLTFGLIVLGAIVRSTGSGLACPDWPLCHGRLLPPLQPQVLLEWSHRFVALAVSLAVAGLALWILFVRPLRRALGPLVLAALGLLALQVLLGALTVWRLLHFSVVTLHLGNALVFLAVLIALAERAGREAVRAEEVTGGVEAEVETRNAHAVRAPRALLLFATVGTLAQILLGGLVSTNHAGLACPDFPACHGEWWPAAGGLAGLQMAHRYAAFALLALLAFVWVRARLAADARLRVASDAVLVLLVVQIVLGVFNVLLAVPVWITAAHLATATALFALLVLATLWAFAPRLESRP